MLRNTVNGLYGSRGSTIMISVVVIILFGAFAFVLNKMKVDTSDIFNNTVMYQRADNAAYSVLEIATYQLYPLNAHSADAPSTAIDDTQGGCDRVTKTYSEGNIVPGAKGLEQCSAEVKCERRAVVIDNDDEYSTYTKVVRYLVVRYFLTVDAKCEAGDSDSDTYYVATKRVYSELVDGD